MSDTGMVMPASSAGVRIDGRRGKIPAHIYLPGGSMPCPAVMVCHGFPGNERLFDFSVALREAGFGTVNFHYSGSWGSDGDFAVSHCFEDCDSVLSWIRKNENGCFDPDRVFVLGHSMGGLMAARAGALYDFVKACVILAPMDFSLAADEALGRRPERYRALVDRASLWLRGMSWESFAEDAAKNRDGMDLLRYAQALSDKPVLVALPEEDAMLPPAEHAGRLIAAIDSFGKGKLSTVSFADDHCFNRNRAALREMTVGFFREQAGSEA